MTGWSDRVREVAIRDYVQPARPTKSRIRIRLGDLKKKMIGLGLPKNHANQVASPLEADKFWKPLGLEMCTPKGQSRENDTIFEFKFVDDSSDVAQHLAAETPAERALRLTEKLRGLMKEEIAAHGGTDSFMRWVRSDEDEEAA
jgi:hypothetical protein